MAYAKKKDGYKGGLQRLKEDIKAKTPRKLYVFFGEESYLKEYYRDELKKLYMHKCEKVLGSAGKA